jgi:LacI family transcriptional regulator
MDRNKEITIYDIAKKLGISTATVSRALNNSPSISERTRKRVHEAARELGYRNNSFAKNLRKQKSHTIGVMIHELVSSFTTSVLGGIEKVTTEAGYDIIIAHSSEQMEKEIKNAHNLFHKRVDGVIVSLSLNTDNLRHFDPFFEKGIPLVFFDRVEENIPGTKVIIDNYRGGFAATQHLLDQGCRNVAIVTGPQLRNVYRKRFLGYRDAVLAAGLPFREDYVIINELDYQSGVDAALHILSLKPVPDGVFVTNDLTAASFMKTVRKHGISVPGDIAVAGFNNDSISLLVEPELTTVNYDGFLIGEVAATQLINHLSGKREVSQLSTIIVNSELIIRHSSLKSEKTEC